MRTNNDGMPTNQSAACQFLCQTRERNKAAIKSQNVPLVASRLLLLELESLALLLQLLLDQFAALLNEVVGRAPLHLLVPNGCW